MLSVSVQQKYGPRAWSVINSTMPPAAAACLDCQQKQVMMFIVLQKSLHLHWDERQQLNTARADVKDRHGSDTYCV